MKSRILLLGVTLSFALAVAAAPALAHEPEAAADVDPLLRNLNLISTSEPVRAQSTNGSRAAADDYALSVNASESASPSRSYTLNQQPLVGCVGACVQPSRALHIAAPFAGEDFEVEHADSYQGVLHFAWSFRSNAPSLLGPGHVGYVIAHLTVAGEDYGEAFHSLDGNGGDVLMRMNLTHSHDCPDDRGHVHNGSGCHEAGNASSMPENQTLEPVHASDFQLRILVQPASDMLRQPLGGQLQVKFDTGGGSWVQVREVPPPPEPMELQAEDIRSDEVPLEVRYSDVDGDGQVDEDELAFVPGVSPVLVFATMGLIGLAMRRLRR